MGTPDGQRLARLRTLRNRPAPELSLTGALDAEKRRLTRTHRAVGGAAVAWAATAPTDLVARSRVLRLARGVLTVEVTDDSARFALDRWLRSGGQAELARRTPSSLTKVRLVL